jgi:succinate-acetate transporter protein
VTELRTNDATEGVPSAPPAPPAEAERAASPPPNPAVLGLLAFSVGGTVLGISLLGYVSAAAQGGSVMPIVYAATGLGVLITTIWAAALGQTFVAAVFGAFTGFWLSYAAFVLGLAHNWYGIPHAQVAHSLAQYLIAWAVVILMLDIVSVYVPATFTMILSSALVAVILLIIANLNGSSVLPKVAGGFILLFSAIGFYDFLAAGIQSVGGRPLSLGPPLSTLLARK